MSGPSIDTLEKMLAAGRDSALLRFSLGGAYLKAGDAIAAIVHLQRAVELDPLYSAAWKALGSALAGAQRAQEAVAAYRQGIIVAERKGDKQAAKEMQVFARRLEKRLATTPGKVDE